MEPRNSNANDQEDLDRTIKKSKATIENRRASLFEDVFDSPTANGGGQNEEVQAEEFDYHDTLRIEEQTGAAPALDQPVARPPSNRSAKPGYKHQHRRSLSENLHELRDPFELFDSGFPRDTLPTQLESNPQS